MGRIGIIDGDLLSRNNHRFPNLACMKLSGYYKENGHDVSIVKSWDENFDVYDKLLISKVFTDTFIPKINHDNVKYGGTGFYFDKAKPLPYRIEHCKPDYTLYYDYIKQFKYSKKLRKQFEAYIDYSIGFLTRGCFRKCKFCVNQNCNMVMEHSPLNEFYDNDKKVICMLDDNFLGFGGWKNKLLELQETNKCFVFKQGLDERLLTDDKCRLLFNSKYYGDYIFAFDNIKDYDLIESKLKLIRKYTNSEHIKFYVLVGFESVDKNDIENAWKRIKLLFDYGCFPYIMRYQNKTCRPCDNSKYKGLYTYIANYCNKPNLCKIMSFREFCYAMQNRLKGTKICNCLKSMLDFEKEHPEIAKQYFDIKFRRWE